MSHRFFSDQPIEDSSEAVLAGTEAHHLLHVLRLGVGDLVTLFDGSGDEFTAQVAVTSRREVTLSGVARLAIDREATIGLTVGVAFPKGDRQRVLVEKLVEVGAKRLVPLVTERSVAVPKTSGLEKLRRTVIEASKQCGRNRLMEIAEPMPFGEFLQSETSGPKLIAHPSGGAWGGLPSRVTEAVIAIGPEGGFSDGEHALALAANWQSVGLGRRILRIETAAIGLAFAITAKDS